MIDPTNEIQDQAAKWVSVFHTSNALKSDPDTCERVAACLVENQLLPEFMAEMADALSVVREMIQTVLVGKPPVTWQFYSFTFQGLMNGSVFSAFLLICLSTEPLT